MFYASNVDDFIEEENRKSLLMNDPHLPMKLVKDPNGKLRILPPVLDRKNFRDDIKRHWGFTCCWCGQKVSSKTHKEYFVIKGSPGDYPNYQRACSEKCGELAGKEEIKDWIIDNGYTDIFNID